MASLQHISRRFTPEAYELHNHGFLSRFLGLAYISSCRMGLKFNQKALGYPITFIPLFHSWSYGADGEGSSSVCNRFP